MKYVRRRMSFRASNLVGVSIQEHWTHTMGLMLLANKGVKGARRVAEMALNRYFERLYAD